MRNMNQAVLPRLPMPIKDMGPWYFWADPLAVGLSDEDAVALRDGVASPLQIDRAMIAGQIAMNALIVFPVHGKPS
jgi:hypothetical protein